MSKKILSIQEQITKLSKFQKIANKAVKSNKLINKIGGITIYAGIADFYAIQGARLIEQILLKSELYQKKKPSFEPHEDNYFYDERIDTRTIVKKIKKILPLKDKKNSSKDLIINTYIDNYLKKTEKFLNYRNIIIHHIANPKITDIEFEEIITKTILMFNEMMEAHQLFFKVCQPYRFGVKELNYFYGGQK